ncbi:hypothetical protein [Flavobacterium sp. Arc2]|uniref:hypothetical protein n=1 Tax=Flavobacterium sp. Arc2 TaxID=3046685 RepID=UPI00352F2AD0
MKIQIKNLDQLEQFISDEAITPKAKFTVFLETLRSYNVLIISFKRGSESMDKEAVKKMLSIIESIKEDPAKSYHGTLLVRWKNPYARLIEVKKD